MATRPGRDTPAHVGRPAQRPLPPAIIKGDDAVPRGLAVASAITLRLLIVAGGVVLVALGARRG